MPPCSPPCQPQVDHYQNWSSSIGSKTVQIAVLYSADYGYSDRLSQTLARGITKAGVQTEMVDMLSVDPTEVGMVIGRSKGLVLMCPNDGNSDAKRTMAAVISAIKPKTKVGSRASLLLYETCIVAVWSTFGP